MSLKNISVKAKIILFVGIFQVLTLIMAILGTIGLGRMENEQDILSGVVVNISQNITNIEFELEKRRSYTHFLSMTESKEMLVDTVAKLKKKDDEIIALFQKIKQYSNENHDGIDRLIKRSSANSSVNIQTQIASLEKKHKEVRESAVNLEKLLDEYIDSKTSFYRKQDVKKLVDTNIKEDEPKKNAFSDELHKFSIFVSSLLSGGKEKVGVTTNSVKGILWGGYIIVLVIAVLIAYLMLRRIADPISKAEATANKFAEGDLTATAIETSEDEIGRLVRALNRASQNMSKLIRDIGDTSDHLASSAEELSATSRNLADGATNQASSLEQTASAITEISESISYVSQSAKDQEKEVIETNKYMKDLSKSIMQITETARLLNEGSQSVLTEAKDGQLKVDESVKRMGAIEESSEQISEIIVVINDIFEQTNLLALNAAIEAARAGESGRGFAVVAEEISKLAARSQKATREIDELIADSISKVNDGKSIVGQIVESFNKILQKSKEAAQLSDNISNATRVQSTGNEKVMKSVSTLSQMAQSISRATNEMDLSAKEIANAIEQVNIVAQNTASSSEEMAASTSELASQSEKLRQLIGEFKVS